MELTDEEKQAKKDQAQAVLDKINAQEDPAAADMDALAKEVDENLTASTKTFGSDDTALDDKLKEAVKSLTDGQVAPKVIEGEDATMLPAWMPPSTRTPLSPKKKHRHRAQTGSLQ